MAVTKVGDAVPEITAVDQNGQSVALSSYRARRTVVVFFYPADQSPICTREACSFRDAYEAFVDAGAIVIGVSGDDVDSHQRFAQAQRLPYILLSDGDGSVRRAFGVPRSFGILPGRVTYVIDRDGIVRHVFNAQFSAERHVQEALAVVRKLEATPDIQ